MTAAVRVGIVVGSESDLPVMGACGDVLSEYGIGWEIGVMSAHRAGDVVRAYALAAHERGLRVLVAGAGAAAHLPGVLASLTTIPVIGVPLAATPLAGFELTPLDRADATRHPGGDRRGRPDGRAERRASRRRDHRALRPDVAARIRDQRATMRTKVQLPEGFTVE